MLISEDLDYFDSDRKRSIPVRLWRPQHPRAWVLFSVGFGGERNGYAYLAKGWESLGIATAVVEHVGSNLDVLKALPGPTRQERNRQVVAKVADPQELAARPRDLIFVHERLRSEFAQLPLGLAGHSYGTYTALSALGLPTVPKLPELAAPLRGASSVLIVSPQPPGMLFSPRAYGLVEIPTLVLTGTKDVRLDGQGSYRERVEVYDHLPPTGRQLAVLDNVEHMDFAGIGLGLEKRLRTITQLTAEWWKTTLWGEMDPGTRAERLSNAGGIQVLGEYR